MNHPPSGWAYFINTDYFGKDVTNMPELKDTTLDEVMRRSGYVPLSEEMAKSDHQAMDVRDRQMPYCPDCGRYQGSPGHAC